MERKLATSRSLARTSGWQAWARRSVQALRERFALAPDDLLRDVVYRRLWSSVLTSSFGAQIMLLALPLTAAVLLHASPTQMGALTTMEIAPFVLFSLPFGVWLDRVRKLPVYIAGELTFALTALSVPLAWWAGLLSIRWLYVVAFTIGFVNTTAGSAAQIVLTQVVRRDRLIEANAKNALASSGAEVAGPGMAGTLIKLLGAPVALLVDAALLVASAAILRGIRVVEEPASGRGAFWPELRAGVRFVAGNGLLVKLALCAGTWQFCYNAATVVNILFATRTLGMSEQAVGLSYVCIGLGTVSASLFGNRLSARLGPGPTMTLGFGACALGWLVLALAPVGPLGVAMLALDLTLFGVGAILIFINFISLRQAVTPAPMLGRMTSTMRWLILIPAGPGALVGGWLGEHVGLRASLATAGGVAAVMTILAWRSRTLSSIRVLPVLADASCETATEMLAP
ncbi:MAG: MFS transporter [Burkholderiaceae bacterium]